jgi:hypothetical protein
VVVLNSGVPNIAYETNPQLPMRSKNFPAKQGAAALKSVLQSRTANGKLGFEFALK